MGELELAAELLDCYIVSNNKDKFALFDNDTGMQCSEFNTLKEWADLNEAYVVLNYTSKNPL